MLGAHPPGQGGLGAADRDRAAAPARDSSTSRAPDDEVLRRPDRRRPRRRLRPRRPVEHRRPAPRLPTRSTAPTKRVHQDRAKAGDGPRDRVRRPQAVDQDHHVDQAEDHTRPDEDRPQHHRRVRSEITLTSRASTSRSGWRRIELSAPQIKLNGASVEINGTLSTTIKGGQVFIQLGVRSCRRSPHRRPHRPRQPARAGPGSLDVLIGGKPAWRATLDAHVCPLSTGRCRTSAAPCSSAARRVLINKLPAARMGDKIVEAGPPNRSPPGSRPCRSAAGSHAGRTVFPIWPRRHPTRKAFLGVGWAFPSRFDADGTLAMAAYEEDVRQAIRIILGDEPRRAGDAAPSSAPASTRSCSSRSTRPR